MPTRTPIRCALCGSLAKVRHYLAASEVRRIAYVECRGCQCRGPAIYFLFSQSLKPHVDAEYAAVAGWNRLHSGRPPEPAAANINPPGGPPNGGAEVSGAGPAHARFLFRRRAPG